MLVYMLTTVDNPYDPFDQFDEWYAYDEIAGYHTCEYLARVTNESYELPEELNVIESNKAIDKILKYNFSGMHKKVVRDIDFSAES